MDSDFCRAYVDIPVRGDMVKRIYLYLIIAAIILIVGIFLGAKVAGGVALLGIGNEIRRRKKETGKAKDEAGQAEQDYEDTKNENDEKIQEAGEDIEAEEFNNADDAQSGINDMLDGDGREE